MDRGVESALQRSGYGFVEESAEETARRRTSWFGEAGRRRIELQEDRMRRDPVYAEKIARRRAAFSLPWTVASASTPSSVSAAIVPEHCYFDPKPAAAAPTATSTSPVAASVVPASAARDGNLAARPPTTCSTQCPSRAVTVAVPALAPVAVPTSSRITVGVAPERYVVNLEPTAVTSTTTSTSPVGASILTGYAARGGDLDLTVPSTCSSLCPGGEPSAPVASMVLGEKAVTTAGRASDSVYHVANCALTRPASSADITFGPRVRMPSTTNSVASVVRESELGKTTPSTSSAVCPELVLNAPADLFMQDVLDIVDSSGSDVFASMSVQQDKPEDVDIAGTHEDEQLLACTSVERPLKLVPASVADDHTFVASMPAIPFTLAALVVDDDCIINKHKVMVTWDTSVNQLPVECDGMCSSLVCTTVDPNSLLPLDPREKTGVPTDYVLSRDFALDACVEQLDADMSGSHGSIQEFCSGQNALGRWSCKGIYVELLQNQLDCAGPFRKQYLECLTACATTYPAKYAEKVPFEDFLLGCFCVVQKNLHPQYLAQSGYWSLAKISIPYHYALLHVGMMLHYGSVYQPWKFVGSSWVDIWRELKCTCCHTTGTCGINKHMELTVGDDTSYVHSRELINGFHHEKLWDPGADSVRGNCVTKAFSYGPVYQPGEFTRSSLSNMWREIQSTHELCFCILWSLAAVLLFFSMETQTWKRPMEQWDPGIARTPDIFTQYFYVSCHIISTAVTAELALEEFYQDAYQLYTTNTALLHDHAHIQAAGSVINIIRPSLLDYLSQSYDTRHHCVSGSASFSWKLPCTCKLSSVWLLRDPGDSTHCSQNLQWQVAWSLGPTPLQTWFSYCTPGKVALYNSEQLQGHIQQPKIGDIQLLKVKLGYSVAASFLCIAGLFSWGHSLEICHYIAWDFRGSLLPKASLSIPWDPGGAEWSRFEGKPLSKDGGMLATYYPPTWAGPWAVRIWAWAARKTLKPAATNTQQGGYEEGGLELDGFGLLCFGFSFLCIPLLLFLLSLVFLLSPVMARS